MSFKPLLRALTPPIVITAARRLRKLKRGRPIEWEYMPEGWKAAEINSKIKGWNEPSVLESYQKKWSQYEAYLKKQKVLGLSPEANLNTKPNLIEHNVLMCYAYALLTAARGKTSLSMLDWGGGMGHYFLISQAIAPDLNLQYSCKDVPLLVEEGRKRLPSAQFYSDETCLESRYDFVMASTSLHYSPDWKATLRGLAGAAGEYLYVTQLPVVMKTSSFVFVQRPYDFGYDTEYLGWCLNRDEFLESATQLGLEVEREFLIGYRPPIVRAPEPCEYRGYLFRTRDLSGSGRSL